MGSTENIANINCSCGRVIQVSITQAGTRLSCQCGSEIRVPNLSELRKLMGKHAYATNPAEVIKKSLADGINPSGESCLCCNSSNPQEFILYAQCESLVVRNSANQIPSIPQQIARFASILFLPRLLLLLLTRNDPPPQDGDILGHDVSVDFPLMVCEQCVRSGQDPRRANAAKKLMEKVPLYRELLRYYPDLQLIARK